MQTPDTHPDVHHNNTPMTQPTKILKSHNILPSKNEIC